MKEKKIFSEDCPVDAFREYVDNLVKKQIEFVDNIPDEYMVPETVVLSNECMRFFLQDSKCDFFVVSRSGNEVSIYWKQSKKYPPLEVRTVLNPNTGEYELDYLKENVSDKKVEFVWDRSNLKCKKGAILIYKIGDALEDVIEMKHFQK